MPVESPRGVIVPLLTPFNDDMSIATDLYVAHAKWLFEQGCAGLAPFGTTGEALSVGIDERIAAIRALVDAGIDPAVMIPGTGLTNVADTARLSRACLDLGCAGVMTPPAFLFQGRHRGCAAALLRATACSDRRRCARLPVPHTTDRRSRYSAFAGGASS